MKEVSEIDFEITKTINNIKNHDFSVADYKLCKSEADVVLEALDIYLQIISVDKLDLSSMIEKATNEEYQKLVDAINTMEIGT